MRKTNTFSNDPIDQLDLASHVDIQTEEDFSELLRSMFTRGKDDEVLEVITWSDDLEFESASLMGHLRGNPPTL